MSSLSAAHNVRKSGDAPIFTRLLESEPFSAVSGYYAECLADNSKATRFLADEFGLSLEKAAEFHVGFSDRSLGKVVPSRDCELGRHLREILRDAGILKRTGHETLRGCVTFPLFTGDKITGIYGRRVDRQSKGEQEITIGTGTRKTLTSDEKHKLPDRDPALTDAVKSVSKAKPDTDDLIIEESQITFVRDDRRYRIRGLEKNTSATTLKINLMAWRDDLVHLDVLDLSKARSRASFIKATAAELFVDVDLIKRDIGTLLLKLETLREEQIQAAKAPKVQVFELSKAEETEAQTFLRDPNLLERIVTDMALCGMVGESSNTLVGYLAATSRKLRHPLAIVIQSSSSAGKTSLMDAILGMMPKEQTLRFSGITSQSLYYLESDAIRHNILAISEEEGVSEATYALKLLQSEGELERVFKKGIALINEKSLRLRYQTSPQGRRSRSDGPGISQRFDGRTMAKNPTVAAKTIQTRPQAIGSTSSDQRDFVSDSDRLPMEIPAQILPELEVGVHRVLAMAAGGRLGEDSRSVA